MGDGTVPTVPEAKGRGWDGAMRGTEFFTGRGSGREAAMDGNHGSATARAKSDRLQDPFTFEGYPPKVAERIKAGLLICVDAMQEPRIDEHANDLQREEEGHIEQPIELCYEPVFSGAPLARHIGKFDPSDSRTARTKAIARAMAMQARNWTLFELARTVYRLAEGPVVVRPRRTPFNGGR